jgi:hypothetical protein
MKNKPKGEGLTEDQAIELVAEALVTHATEAQTHALDPFEEYTFAVQSKIFSEKIDFKKRCLKGFRALLQVCETQ